MLKFFAGRVSAISFPAEQPGSPVWGAAAFLVTLAVFMVYFMGQYPGGMTQDTISQYSQAMGDMQYNDWHPALHTFLFFSLPMLLSKSLGWVVFLQLLYFSLAFGYLIYVMHSNGCPQWLLGAFCVFVWINPYLSTFLMFPWKDLGLLIFAILLMAYYIQILCSKGEWLKKPQNLIAFSVVAMVAVYLRHNAILFVGPLVVIALFYAMKKNGKLRAFALGAMVVAYCLVKLLYAAVGVEAPGSRTLETVGLPATIWCNVMQQNPEALPEETREVMYAIAPPEIYENNYTPGNFNSVKWLTGEVNVDVIDAMSYGDVIKYTLQCFRYAPGESVEALAKLTDQVWGITGSEEPLPPFIDDNPYGIAPKPVPGVSSLVRQVQSFLSMGVGRIIFGSIGVQLLLMLSVALLLFVKRRTAFVHIIPLFCYDFGTMLLLSGPDYRSFLLNIPLWITVVFVMLKDDRAFRPGSARINHSAKSERMNQH